MSYVYLGYGVTDENGVAKLDHDAEGQELQHSYTGVGAGEIDVLASLDNPIVDGSIVSETYTVIDAIVYDTGIQGTANDSMWNVLNNGSLTRQANYSIVGGTSAYTGIRLKINNATSIPLSSNYAFEFTILGITGGALLNMYDNASHNIVFQANKHYKVVITDKIYYWIDGVEQTPITHNNQSNYQVSIINNVEDGEVQFKDFVAYPV